jgi:peptidoglycan hydrolase-like protein with peptidoglycan-binding domain
LSRSVAVTRSFDRSTERAVRGYQLTHAIKVDGIAGAKTWAALQAGQ